MEPPPPTTCPCPGCASPRADAWLGQTLRVRDSLPVGACCRHQSKHGAFPLLLSKQDQPRLSSTAGLRQQEQPGPVLGSISTAFPDAECFLPTCSKLFLPANINLAATGPSSEQDFSRKVHPSCPPCQDAGAHKVNPCSPAASGQANRAGHGHHPQGWHRKCQSWWLEMLCLLLLLCWSNPFPGLVESWEHCSVLPPSHSRPS